MMRIFWRGWWAFRRVDWYSIYRFNNPAHGLRLIDIGCIGISIGKDNKMKGGDDEAEAEN